LAFAVISRSKKPNIIRILTTAVDDINIGMIDSTDGKKKVEYNKTKAETI
jgi:hypothetical protein